MSDVLVYPSCCRASIRRIKHETGMRADDAYSLMLMTAALMDLRPEDERVAEMILQDCGIEPRTCA